MSAVKTENRIDWPDLLRGVCAIWVILAHVEGTPPLYHILNSFMMIPGFFIVSGYLCKIDRKKIGLFYGNRVLKIVILYVVWMFLQPFCAVRHWKSIFQDPMNILRIIKNSALEIVRGDSLWFLPCLVMVMLIFSIIYLISKNNYLVMFIISAVIFCVAFIFIKGGKMFIWSANTALIGQFFYVLGYIMKETDIFQKEFFIKNEKILRYSFTGAYIVMLVAGTLLLGDISINMALNEYHNRIMTFIGFVTGNSMLILWARRIGKIRVINYIGAHSLVYFALGSLYTVAVYKWFIWLSDKLGAAFIANHYFANLMVMLICAAFTLIPCLIIDKWIPFLNGRFKIFK